MQFHFAPTGGRVAACDLDAACVPTACDRCLADLPTDAHANADVREYVQHYCGLDCLAVWRERAESAATVPR